MQRLTSTLSLRELTPLEAITPELLPHELRGWQFPYLVPDWCWVVEHSQNGPISLIITSPVHGVLFIWRVLATASAKSSMSHLLAAYPKILENARVRGCVGVAMFLHDQKKIEAKIARIALRLGASIEPWQGMLVVKPWWSRMPQLALIAEIVSAAVAAAGVGTSIYEGDKTRTATADAQKSAQTAAQNQALLQKREALLSAGANAQSQTGGSLTGTAGSSFADILAGYGGNTGGPQTGQPNQQGEAATSATNATPNAAPDIQSILAQLGQGQGQGNGFSGGWNPPPQANQGRFNLSQMNLG